jgi:hypothetical protein
MHDELVFRIKKTHIDVIPEIEKVMMLEDTLRKIKWNVPLAVDVEIGSSWDVSYEYPSMLEYLKEKHGVDKVAYIYQKGQNYEEHLSSCKKYLSEKKSSKAKEEEDAKNNPVDKSIIQKDDFKKEALAIVSKLPTKEDNTIEKEDLVEFIKPELVKETVPLEVKPLEKSSLEIDESSLLEDKIESLEGTTATASDLDKYFSVIQSANLSDLPEEAHQKLKRFFYEKEVERILIGSASEDDSGIELPIIVHDPIDNSKKNLMGYIIDSCPGNGLVKFLTEKKEELHKDWIKVDVLKAAVMSKIFNL